MNLSLIVIEKIKTFFSLPATQFVSLASMARTMDKEDFQFLADVPDGQADDKDLIDKIYASKYYFSYLANSLPNSGEIVWNPELDPENTLGKKYPNILENAELNRKNQPFVKKWIQEQNGMELAELTDPVSDASFLETACPPSFYDEIEQNWTKFKLSATDLANLDQAVRQKYPPNVYENVDPLMNGEKLDIQSLQFEIKLISVNRRWFNRDLLDNRNWKSAGAEIISNGVDSREGKLPAYPTSLIFVKNVVWELVPGTANNVAVLQKIQEGMLTLGSFPVQGIPQGVNLTHYVNLRASDMTPKYYAVFNKNLYYRLEQGDLTIKTDSPTTPGKASTANTTGKMTTTTVTPSKITPTKVQLNDPLVTGLHTTVIPANVWATNFKVNFKASSSVFLREQFRYSSFFVTEVKPETTTYTVSGNLISKGTNVPIADASVTVLFGEGKRLSKQTDQNGAFTLTGITKGEITISITKNGFESYQETVTLSGDLQRKLLLGQVPALPPGAFYLFGVVNSRLPHLPNPDPNGEFVSVFDAVAP